MKLLNTLLPYKMLIIFINKIYSIKISFYFILNQDMQIFYVEKLYFNMWDLWITKLVIINNNNLSKYSQLTTQNDYKYDYTLH